MRRRLLSIILIRYFHYRDIGEYARTEVANVKIYILILIIYFFELLKQHIVELGRPFPHYWSIGK